MKRALVTGGLGFIGSNMSEYLADRAWDVTVIDNLSTGRIENKDVRCDYIIDDITTANLLDIVKNVDYVFHFAALARVPRSIEEPVNTHNTNVDGTLKLLDACKKVGIERFIYSSSSSVYGEQDIHVMKEGMHLNPLSPYALHKMIGERYCDMYNKFYDLSVVKLRYFNVYGKNQIVDGAYSLVIGKFMRQMQEGKKMTVYGDGSHTRAYTNVQDVVKANYLAATTDNIIGETFNIGTSVETSVLDIAKMLGGEYELIQPHPRGNAEEARKVADNTKALQKLGWSPKVSIEDGIKLLLKQNE